MYADRAAAALRRESVHQDFSAQHNEPGAEFGRTMAGLHYGDAVVGNFGGEGRLTYTALGDAMNCAARLEGANKYLKTVALVSDEARKRTTLDVFRPMGRIILSGRATPVVVWEPAPDFDPKVRLELVHFGSLEPVRRRPRRNRTIFNPSKAAALRFSCRLGNGTGGRRPTIKLHGSLVARRAASAALPRFHAAAARARGRSYRPLRGDLSARQGPADTHVPSKARDTIACWIRAPPR